MLAINEQNLGHGYTDTSQQLKRVGIAASPFGGALRLAAERAGSTLPMPKRLMTPRVSKNFLALQGCSRTN